MGDYEMYVDVHSPNLRQGDVIRNAPFCLMDNMKFDDGNNFLHTVIDISKEPTVILSNDCDITPENPEGKSPWLLISPIQKTPPQHRDDYPDLDSINRMKEDEYNLVGYFYYHPHPMMENTDFEIRFFKIYCLHKKWIDQGMKILELTDEYRLLLQDKLAYYFIRGD